MAAKRIDARDLPDSPLDAAAAFSVRIVPAVRQAAGSHCVVLFDHADHTHRAWRRSMVEELAREAAPARVNGIVGPDGSAVEDVVAYLEGAPGITGQVLEVARVKA